MKPRDTNAERKAELKRVFGNAPCSSPFWRRIYWALRGFQFWLCFYDTEAEIEVDDLNSNPFNTMPPSLSRLHHATAFDKKWIMFLYRNFKQAITKQTGRPYINFEDLVLCLFDLTDGSHHLNGDLSTGHSTANFIANIIGTDEKGRVSLDSWVGYASAIWGLRACRSAAAANAARFGLGHGSSVHASKSISLHGDSEVAASKRLAPLFERYARERFLEFDTDGDGFVTLDDIEREIDRLYGNELILHTKAEYLC